MANYTGANVITTSDIQKYQPDAFDFGISTTATETTNFLAQTTNDIFRALRQCLSILICKVSRPFIK